MFATQPIRSKLIHHAAEAGGVRATPEAQRVRSKLIHHTAEAGGVRARPNAPPNETGVEKCQFSNFNFVLAPMSEVGRSSTGYAEQIRNDAVTYGF